MATTAAGRDQGKTAFIKDVLAKNKQANAKAVNDAWKEAGHEGKISTTLVQIVRNKLGLTRGNRGGRRPSTGRAGAARGTVARRVGRPPKAIGRTEAAPSDDAKPRATEGKRTRVLTRLEGEIDDMIFEIKGVGGLQEFEEVLRKARRILARSHGE